MSMRLKGVSETRGAIPADDPEISVAKTYMKLAGLTREKVIRRRLIKARLNQIRDFETRIREIEAEEATYCSSIETSLAAASAAPKLVQAKSLGKDPRNPEERERGSGRARSRKSKPGRRAGVELRY
jgi:hypothetical protein